MNENLNLEEILKDCPKGTNLYSIVYGEVEFNKINKGEKYPIRYINSEGDELFATTQGLLIACFDGECTLFPSKEQRDWSEFTAPWYKKEMDTNSMSNKDDERLRKTAIAFLKDFAEQGYENAVECMNWLEKQGEQEEPQVYETEDAEIITYSETDGYKFVEPKFHEGDWVVNKFGDSWHIDSLDKKNYQVSDGKGNYNYFHILKQDEMHLWTIQDAKDGDVLVNGSNIFIFHFINNRRLMGYCHVNMDDGNFYNDIGRNECFCTIDAPVTPATKEQRDLLFQKIKEAGYEWDVDNKELKKVELKSNCYDTKR